MHLDIQTLSVVTVFITALLGALLVFAGLQNHSIRAPMWWGAAHIVNACGLGLLTSHGAAPDVVTNDLANALVLLGYGLTWAGARVFDGREVRLLYVLLAPVFWLALRRIPGFSASETMSTIVVSTMLAVLALLAAEEFWRGRDEPLMSRWPTVVVLLAYAAVLLARVPATLLTRSFGDDALLSGLSFALLSFGALLFTVVMAFLRLNMTKERTELKHKINSLIDPLSGVTNRRAFLDGTADLLAQQEIDREPLAVLLFDLDHFKQINDQFVHAVGDAVLQNFAATASHTLGGDVLFRGSAARNSRRVCRSALSTKPMRSPIGCDETLQRRPLVSAPSNWRRASASASRSAVTRRRALPICWRPSIVRCIAPRSSAATGGERSQPDRAGPGNGDRRHRPVLLRAAPTCVPGRRRRCRLRSCAERSPWQKRGRRKAPV